MPTILIEEPDAWKIPSAVCGHLGQVTGQSGLVVFGAIAADMTPTGLPFAVRFASRLTQPVALFKPPGRFLLFSDA